MNGNRKRQAGNILGLAICLLWLLYMNDCSHYRKRQENQDKERRARIENDEKEYPTLKAKWNDY